MIFRTARHTNNLVAIIDFYCRVIGLEVLGSFEDHDGYDGVFIGRKEQNWHLEFTTSNDNASHVFDDDDILVFYSESITEFEQFRNRIAEFGIKTYEPKNPYWERNGILLKDPDGYNVIVSNQKAN